MGEGVCAGGGGRRANGPPTQKRKWPDEGVYVSHPVNHLEWLLEICFTRSVGAVVALCCNTCAYIGLTQPVVTQAFNETSRCLSWQLILQGGSRKKGTRYQIRNASVDEVISPKIAWTLEAKCPHGNNRAYTYTVNPQGSSWKATNTCTQKDCCVSNWLINIKGLHMCLIRKHQEKIIQHWDRTWQIVWAKHTHTHIFILEEQCMSFSWSLHHNTPMMLCREVGNPSCTLFPDPMEEWTHLHISGAFSLPGTCRTRAADSK